MSKKNAAGSKNSGQKKVRNASQKEVDNAAASVVSSESTDQGAGSSASQPQETSMTEKKTMNLTYKAHGKNGRYAFYKGAAADVRIPITAFPDPKNLPTSIEVADGVFAPAKQPKAKMTAEERKAAQAARPKLTLAEKIAKREEALAKLKAKAQADAEKQAAGNGTGSGAEGTQPSM